MNADSLDSCVFFDAHYFKSGDDPDVYFRGRQPKLPERELISRRKPKKKSNNDNNDNNCDEINNQKVNRNQEEEKEMEEEAKESSLNRYGQEIPSKNPPEGDVSILSEYQSNRWNTDQIEQEWKHFNPESENSESNISGQVSEEIRLSDSSKYFILN